MKALQTFQPKKRPPLERPDLAARLPGWIAAAPPKDADLFVRHLAANFKLWTYARMKGTNHGTF